MIEPTLRQAIVNFLSELDAFHSDAGRKAILLTAGLDKLLPNLTFQGKASQVVPLLVDELARYGIVPDQQQPALICLLLAVKTHVGIDKQAILQNFCDRMLTAQRSADTPPAAQDRQPVGTPIPQIFICYAREDQAMAQRLYADLETAGLRPWMDREDILPGQNWKHEIKRAMKASQYVLALLSSHALSKAGYVQKELKEALEWLQHLPTSTIFLIPVRLDDCEPEDEQLQEIQWEDLFPSYDAGLRRILRVFPQVKPIRIEEPPKPPPSKEQPQPKQSEQEQPVTRQAEQRQTEKKQTAQKPSTPKPVAQKPPAQDTTSANVIRLRSEPLTVAGDEFINVFKLAKSQRPLEYIQNDYVDQGDVVLDRVTGLMWQKSGSKEWLTYPDTEKYIKDVNQQKFGGYADWRLPTIPELMSLLEPEKQSNGLYISPIFDNTQSWCWSADKKQIKGESSAESAWYVGFDFGRVDWGYFDGGSYVRAVRP